MHLQFMFYCFTDCILLLSTMSSKNKLTLTEIQRMQNAYGHPSSRPQDIYPRVMEAARLRNQWTRFPFTQIPNLSSVINWHAPSFLKHTFPTYNCRALSVPLTFINEKARALEMIEHLEKQKIIAVDLEYANQSCYRDQVGLISLSSLTRDFIFDPFPLFEFACTTLKTLLENPNIIKLFFDPANDVKMLMTNFMIFPVGTLCLQKLHSI